MKALLNEKIVKHCSNQRIRTKYARKLIDFLLFNKHFKHQDQVRTSCYYYNWFFNYKRLFKNNYQNASSRIVTICEVFPFVVNLSNAVDLSNRYRCPIMLKSSQCE